MTKILYVSPAFYPAFYYGGPIYSTYGLAKELLKRNIDVKYEPPMLMEMKN